MHFFIVEIFNNVKRGVPLLVSLLMLFLLTPSFVTAVDFSTVRDGNWSEPSTWDGNEVPTSLTAGDRILIRNEITSLVDITIPEGVVFQIETGGTFNNNDMEDATLQKPTIRFEEDVTFGGVFTNNDGGTVLFSGEKAIIPEDGIFTNWGVFTFDGDATDFQVLGRLNNSGTISVDPDAAGEVTYTFGNTATLQGNGNIEGDLDIPGTISPGNSVGTITITGSLTLSGTLNIEIESSTSFDVINVTGNIDLSGATVEVTFDSYTPEDPESYIYLTFGTSSGTAPAYTLPAIATWNTAILGTLEILSLLPVELSHFDAEIMEDQVQLYWQTANELNNSGFEIQHSSNGINWEKLGFLDGMGNTIVPQAYDFLHTNPAIGVNYYRLKQIDFDGKFEYSQILSTNLQGMATSALKVFPNPTTEYVYLDLDDSEPIGQILTLQDGMGKIIWQKEITQDLERLDLSTLSKGTYYLILDKGDVVEKQAIIVQ